MPHSFFNMLSSFIQPLLSWMCVVSSEHSNKFLKGKRKKTALLWERQSECCRACIITDKRPCQRKSQWVHINTISTPHLTSHPHPFSSGFWLRGWPRSACQQWEHIAERSKYHPASLAVGEADTLQRWEEF